MHLSLNHGQFYITRTWFSNRVSLCYLLQGSMAGHGGLLSAKDKWDETLLWESLEAIQLLLKSMSNPD